MNNQQSKFDQLAARVKTDAAFNAAFFASPTTILREQGIDIPPGASVEVFPDPTNGFRLSMHGQGTELSEDDLAELTGGAMISVWRKTSIIDGKRYTNVYGCWFNQIV